MLAAANNHLECVKELLKNGADPAARRLVSTAYSMQYIVFHTLCAKTFFKYSKQFANKPSHGRSICILNHFQTGEFGGVFD